MTNYKDINILTLESISDSEVILQYVNVFLSTTRFSIPFLDFGYNLEEELFEVVDPINAKIIFSKLCDYLVSFMPDLKIDYSKSGVSINYQNSDGRGEYVLTLYFQVDDKKMKPIIKPIIKPV